MGLNAMKINHKNIEWSIHSNRVLRPNVSPHVNVDIEEKDAKYFLKVTKANMIIWTNHFDSTENKNFWYVIKDGKFSLDELDTKRRNEIKKGLKHCCVKKIDPFYIAENGYQVYEKASRKYGTKPPLKETFYKTYSSFTECEDRDFWGVYKRDNDLLIGIGHNILKEGACLYSEIKLDPDYLNLNSSYALIHEMNDYYLNLNDFLYVSDGARSINHQTNIQDFLIKKFKFRRAYCDMNVIYSTKLRIAISILYLFRKVISQINGGFVHKVKGLLKLEEIRRSQNNKRTIGGPNQ